MVLVSDMTSRSEVAAQKSDGPRYSEKAEVATLRTLGTLACYQSGYSTKPVLRSSRRPVTASAKVRGSQGSHLHNWHQKMTVPFDDPQRTFQLIGINFLPLKSLITNSRISRSVAVECVQVLRSRHQWTPRDRNTVPCVAPVDPSAGFNREETIESVR